MGLSVENLRKTYRAPLSRKPPMEAVRGVNFEIRSGEIYALLGPNGAGKTSIIKMLAGLVVPTSGRIILNGREMSGGGIAAYKQLSAILEGIRNVYWRLTPLENLHYFANLRGIPSRAIKDRALELLRDLDIEAKKKNQSQHLSRGMLQKLALATALITDPDILLLDEPTLGLDVASARRIKDVLLDLARKEGKCVLLTTHQMDLVEELADRAGIIQEGSLIREGTLADLRAVFHSQIYRFKVRGSFAPPREWKKENQALVREKRREYTEFELDCKDKNGVYRVLDALRARKKEILSMHRVTEDLEEVFLMTLSGNGAKEKRAKDASGK